MPSFDIASEVEFHELTNTVDQANREISQRFDFKGSGAEYTLEENVITLKAPTEFQTQQMLEVLRLKMAKRDIDTQCMTVEDPQVHVHETRQIVNIKQGIDQPAGKKIVKLIKESKLKVQAAIQGDKIRVTGKKRDDLQDTIQCLKDSSTELPLQFINFRD